MLTGKRAFDGEDVTDTLANVLKIEPDWTALPSEIPPAIRTLLQSCLTKDRRRRVADISTALFVLEKGASLAPPISLDAAVSQAQADAAVSEVRRVCWPGRPGAASRSPVPRPFSPAPSSRRRSRGSPRARCRLVSRVCTIAPSGTAALTINGVDRDLAITPDGSRVVYVGNRGTQLFVRALDALEPVAVFTGAPRGPFVSPMANGSGSWTATPC